MAARCLIDDRLTPSLDVRADSASGDALPLTLDQFIARALQQQGELTAVERFAQWHDGPAIGHDLAPQYRSLLPTHAPATGQQYAFDVDLDACSGCKACVTACHSLNGLDEGEAFREVGTLLAANGATDAAIQYVTTACHHCLEPACAAACPVNAYEKDPVTGIVRHLDDQCFGCQYCTLACPYDVPKYHAGKGIVRKCDMCSQRLAVGEAPACVQSCPNQAIRITVVDCDEVLHRTETSQLAPGAVTSAFTRPTSSFRTRRESADSRRAIDAGDVRPQHVHAALVIMLALTQASVGAAAVTACMLVVGDRGIAASSFSLAMGCALLGIASSTLHLGRPAYAFRALIGIRHSWLSREIAAFSAYLPLLGMAWAASTNWGAVYVGRGATLVVSLAAVAAGAAGVWCSAKIYQFTRRPFWSGGLTWVKFSGTCVVAGLSLAIVAKSFSAREVASGLAICAATFAGMKLLWEAGWGIGSASTATQDSRETVCRHLRGTLAIRFLCGVVGGVVMPLVIVTGLIPAGALVPWTIVAAALVLCGELAERTIYFAAVRPW
ncbi:MAG: dimethyl sulfoxide reductase anchor subunit, partial [Planctomycetales bacterium]|nr:dimethyl sulfoxide reductase anchor subunit [Planctomycetales bacterium]